MDATTAQPGDGAATDKTRRKAAEVVDRERVSRRRVQGAQRHDLEERGKKKSAKDKGIATDDGVENRGWSVFLLDQIRPPSRDDKCGGVGGLFDQARSARLHAGGCTVEHSYSAVMARRGAMGP